MKQLILVTGSHRSGTTWLGNVLSKTDDFFYINEPFNIDVYKKHTPFKYWFEYIIDEHKEHQEEVINYINSFLYFSLETINQLKYIRSLKELLRFSLNNKNKILYNNAIIKDPIAFMSAEWLFQQYSLDVVVMIRHPAAFVSSLKVKHWFFDFNNFLEQKHLMQNYLSDYKDKIIDYSLNNKSITKQGILLWNIFHSIILKYQEKYQEKWCFVKHEDLSLNPIEEYELLYKKLNLLYSKKVQEYIIKTSEADLTQETMLNSTRVKEVRRNSVANIKSWKERLTVAEIDLIKSETQSIWKYFYTENDW